MGALERQAGLMAHRKQRSPPNADTLHPMGAGSVGTRKASVAILVVAVLAGVRRPHEGLERGSFLLWLMQAGPLAPRVRDSVCAAVSSALNSVTPSRVNDCLSNSLIDSP